MTAVISHFQTDWQVPADQQALCALINKFRSQGDA
jgi:hypothetical protein